MHRQILGVIDPKMHVDHIDHDGLNNQRSNIRVATCRQNSWNQGGRKNTTSQFIGVSWCSRTGTWVAQLRMPNGVSPFIGRFHTEVEAAIARDDAARRHRGEFAVLNFP